MKLYSFKGILLSLGLAVGLGAGAFAATVAPGPTALTYKLAKGNKLVAQFDAQSVVESWSVISKTSNKFTAKATFAPLPVDFGYKVATVLEGLDKNVVNRGKTQKNAIVTRMFGANPAMRSWTRPSVETIRDSSDGEVSQVPVPAGGLLLLASLGGLGLLRRKKSI